VDTVDDDMVSTKYDTYSRATLTLELMFGRTKDLCGPVLLTSGRCPWPCPSPDEEGHGPGGMCHVLCGQDPFTIAKKRAVDSDAPPPRKRNGTVGFRRPTGK
jgi:hypothetical protein